VVVVVVVVDVVFVAVASSLLGIIGAGAGGEGAGCSSLIRLFGDSILLSIATARLLSKFQFHAGVSKNWGIHDQPR